jgi:hypothetical protein
MTKVFKYIFIISALFFSGILHSQSFQKSINVNYGYGSLVAHRNAMNHMVKGNSNYFDLNYTVRTKGTKESHSYFNYPWFGVGANFVTSGNPEQIGNVVGVYSFGILRLGKNEDFPFRIKVGAGLGYVQHIFNITTNNQAIAIGSHLNSNMVFRFEKLIPLFSSEKKGSELYFGFGLTHFSNSSFKSPNLGLNFVTFNVGYQLGWKKFEKEPLIENAPSKSVLELSVVGGGGFKEQAQPTYPKYIIGLLNFQLEHNFNFKNSGYVSLDFLRNSSLSLANKSLFQQGIFFGYMLNFDRFKFGTGMGIYTFNRTFDEQLFYHKLVIDYKMSKKTNVQLSMRTHWATADFVSLNLRYLLWEK